MKDTNPNIESNDFPEELRYSDENWQLALDKIESHERSIRRKRFLTGLLGLGILLIGYFSYVHFSEPSIELDTVKVDGTSIQKTNQKKSVITDENGIKESGGATLSDVQNESAADNKSIASVEKKRTATKEVLVETIVLDKADDNTTVNDAVVDDEVGEGNKPNQQEFTNVNTNTKALEKNIDKNIIENPSEEISNNVRVNIESNDREAKDQEIAIDTKSTDQELERISEKKENQISGTNESNGKVNSDPVTTTVDDSEYNESKQSMNGNAKNVTMADKEEISFQSQLPLERMIFKTIAPLDRTNNSIKEKLEPISTLSNHYEKPFRIPKELIAFKLGTSPWLDYGKSSKWEGLNVSYGVNYERNITRKYGYGLGVEYFRISHVPQALERRETSYGYGYESIVTSVRTDKLDFISFPVFGNYRLHDRVQLELGFGLSYILASKNTISKTRLTNTTSQELSSESTSGYYQGFKRATTYSSIGIRYWFLEKYGVSATYHHGFSDFTINEEFGNTDKDVNSKLVFSIKRIIK